MPHIGGRLGWIDPFVKAHPEMRNKRRTDDLPADVDQAVVTSIRLIKKDDLTTRITKERLQDMDQCRELEDEQAKVDFAFSDTIEKARHNVYDHRGKVMTRRGAAGWRVDAVGLKLTDKYVLVTTDFADGQPDFVNAGMAIGGSRRFPRTVYSGIEYRFRCERLVRRPAKLRTAGLTFDYGPGAAPVTWDGFRHSGKRCLVAFTRGRNRYLCGALCETEPRVQTFWLDCLEEMIATGVDGVDFREENHSMVTDHPEDYGFNEVILEQCGDLKGEALTAKIAEVRGRAYTEFLRRCKGAVRVGGETHAL